MRRLTGALAGRFRQERGAVAVFVALGMTVLLAFAAIAIDTSASRRDQQVLRNAADAAALAVAMDCAKAVPVNPDAAPVTECPSTIATGATATAIDLVTDNAGSGRTVTTSLHGRTVEVTVSAAASRPIPIGPGTVSVTSTAVWTPENFAYTAAYPLAISYCRYLQLPARSPSHLASEPNGLWLLPARQQITPAAWNASDSCNGPNASGALVLPNSAMTPTDAGAACGTSSAQDRNVTGQPFQPVAFASRTCVASSQFGDVTSWPWGGYQIVVPVYDRVDGDQYHVWDYLGFHVMGSTADGGLWGFSTGKARTQSTTVPPSVRLTT
jgi:Flp pilus assembly protein TadG